MDKFVVLLHLEALREDNAKWAEANVRHNADVAYVMKRLLLEAVNNRMSVDEVAKAAGITAKRVRMMMRDAGLDPKSSKVLLSKQAAEALAENAALLAIEPQDMDLMSPLAYLPMGREMRERLTSQKRGRQALQEDMQEIAAIKKAAVAEFVGRMSASYRKHSANAVDEDMIAACIWFDIDPETWYDNPAEATELRASVAYHRTLGTFEDSE